MSAKIFSVLAIAIFCTINVHAASSQSPSSQGQERHGLQAPSNQPHVSQGVDQGPNTGKTQDAGYPNTYYRSNNSPSTASSPGYQGYSGTTYPRESYGTSRDAAGNPIFGVSSNADFQLSAYFGQIFWGFVAVTLTLVVSIWIIRFFSGTDVVGGLVEKIKESGATGKSLDLDRLTNVVYQAFDSYGKWAAKEARHAVDINGKSHH